MYNKKALLEGLDWEDITDKLKWKSEGKLWCGYVEKTRYPLVVKGKGSSYMKMSRMFITCGKGTFVSFGHGVYWLTRVNGKQRLLYLSSEKEGSIRDFGVHGC